MKLAGHHLQKALYSFPCQDSTGVQYCGYCLMTTGCEHFTPLAPKEVTLSLPPVRSVEENAARARLFYEKNRGDKKEEAS